MDYKGNRERSACGVGFVVSRNGERSHEVIRSGLHALCQLEHRGACGQDGVTGDGAGVMTDIPFALFGYEPGSIAIATIFLPRESFRQRSVLGVFEETFAFLGIPILEYRDVPLNRDALGRDAGSSIPEIRHVVLGRPDFCRTDDAFNKLLYLAKQRTRSRGRNVGLVRQLFFTSLSTTTIVYKGLTTAEGLVNLYPDLSNPQYQSRFTLFHRRFSTNSRTTWDKAQPFRLVAHNGEINTVAGNRSWAFARERALGLPADELLTREGISDSGSLNEMVEALKYRSSIPEVEDILAIMMPPADIKNSYYKFWSRAMEPWDGPAFIAYADGESIGARLDRNGFRPCRWSMTADRFYLASEAGAFSVDEAEVIAKGALGAGRGVTVVLETGEIRFEDPSKQTDERSAAYEPRLRPFPIQKSGAGLPLPASDGTPDTLNLFLYAQEDIDRVLVPLARDGKEPIGSMGNTACPAILSDEPLSLFDFLYHDFAQVTNPPLDFLREQMVTDMTTYVGKMPNIFAPKQLIPPPIAWELPRPVLSEGELRVLVQLPVSEKAQVVQLGTTFMRRHGGVGMRSAIHTLARDAVLAVRKGASVIVLSDAEASYEQPPIPSLLALRAVVQALGREGMQLDASVVVATGEVRETHHAACLLGFGAAAVCPYLALRLIEQSLHKDLAGIDPSVRVQNLIQGFTTGILKIMSKMGISVFRSYQGSQLFSALGLHAEFIKEFFPGIPSAVGGYTFEGFCDRWIESIMRSCGEGNAPELPRGSQYKELHKGKSERHSMTNQKSRLVHAILKEPAEESTRLYGDFVRLVEAEGPQHIRDLVSLRYQSEPILADASALRAAVLRRFGSGAMSFGAISAEAQRDIIAAMAAIGGRSNSGEGGDNPYLPVDGTSATIKQIASGRFGVTAEYLSDAVEFQIKIAQGAKPGEGGQLMSIKVTEEIARARHAESGIDLISPPPMHDIYSIEDLKELIHELKTFKPTALVSVKLVSGSGIGAVAVGVVKAGADVIQISGGDGGTGAASLSSMRHAGLPWETGLSEVHRALVTDGLRDFVQLRVDGGLQTGRDIILAAICGADQFDFGKILLVAEGCVMARICEQNRCPAGIATHDPKFKAKYKGTAAGIVRFLTLLADDVVDHLAKLGYTSLDAVRGATGLLEMHPRHEALIRERGIDLELLLGSQPEWERGSEKRPLLTFSDSPLNKRILADAVPGASLSYQICSTDRAVLAPLAARIATQQRQLKRAQGALAASDSVPNLFEAPMTFAFYGSAGQGFGVFLTEGIIARVHGEANDSVGKGMSGGVISLLPPAVAGYDPTRNAILGNCALYGATGGTLFAYGRAGDRFAVRNSGATAVVEGVGLHACEYMTGGTVVILGATGVNVGAGMTGGMLVLPREQVTNINASFIQAVPFDDEDEERLRAIVTEYYAEVSSTTAAAFLSSWERFAERMVKCVPVRKAREASIQNFLQQTTSAGAVSRIE